MVCNDLLFRCFTPSTAAACRRTTTHFTPSRRPQSLPRKQTAPSPDDPCSGVSQLAPDRTSAVASYRHHTLSQTGRCMAVLILIYLMWLMMWLFWYFLFYKPHSLNPLLTLFPTTLPSLSFPPSCFTRLAKVVRQRRSWRANKRS